MPLPTDLNLYEDIRTTLDQALSEERGLRIEMPTPGKAVYYRQRVMKFRQLHRLATLDVYPEGDPQRGRSPYDDLDVSVEDQHVILLKTDAPVVTPL